MRTGICCHCGLLYGLDEDGLIRYHNWPIPARQVCPGSKRQPKEEPMDEQTVYTLTVQGVYDHGCVGIFTDLDNAKTAAQEMLDKSDGYHDIRIEEMRIDVPLENRASSILMYGRDKRGRQPSWTWTSWRTLVDEE